MLPLTIEYLEPALFVIVYVEFKDRLSFSTPHRFMTLEDAKEMVTAGKAKVLASDAICLINQNL